MCCKLGDIGYVYYAVTGHIAFFRFFGNIAFALAVGGGIIRYIRFVGLLDSFKFDVDFFSQFLCKGTLVASDLETLCTEVECCRSDCFDALGKSDRSDIIAILESI